MNTWFRRAVGTVGVAGGILLLGAGAAHADDSALVPGQLDDLFSPVGGPNNQSLQFETRESRIDTSATSDQAGRRTTTATASTGGQELHGAQLPSVLRNLPLSTVLPTDRLGLPRTTSSRISSLPSVPVGAMTAGLPMSSLPTGLGATGVPNTSGHTSGHTEDSLSGLPLVGSLEQLGLPAGAVPAAAGDTLQGTSIADTRTAFPGVPSADTYPTDANWSVESGPATEGLPIIGSLPLVDGLPVRGTLKPVDDFAIPLGGGLGSGRRSATEADSGLPLVGSLPLGGSDVLKNDSVTGVPVIGGVGPTPGVSTTAVANRFVPTTGALPQAASRLPLLTESAYAPKHAGSYSPRHATGPRHAASEEALPLAGGLPLVGGLTGGGLPLVGGLTGGGLPVVGGLTGGGLPLVGGH